MGVYTEIPVTVSDIDELPEDGNRYEVIEGELYVSTAPGFSHQSALGDLYFALAEYLRRNRIGRVVLGLGVIFDQFNGVVPDLIFISNDRFDRILVNGRLKAAPEIVVEILSPGKENGQRDRVTKRKLFSSTGVSEYWILDPENRTIELYRKRKEGGFGRSLILQSDDDLTSPLLPDFRVPVGQLFELDRAK